MQSSIIIPIKAPGSCKSRLRSVLTDREREQLVVHMLSRVLSACRMACGAERVALLGPDRHGLSSAIQLLPDPGKGLNVALGLARDSAMAAGMPRVTLISADLPWITADDVRALTDVAEDEIAIAPDRNYVGTNAISLPLPTAQSFKFYYGMNSFAAHCAEASQHGLRSVSVVRDGLQFDVDHDEDLAALHCSAQ